MSLFLCPRTVGLSRNWYIQSSETRLLRVGDLFLGCVPVASDPGVLLIDFSVALEPQGGSAGRTAMTEPCPPHSAAPGSAHLILTLTEKEDFTVLNVSRSKTLNPVPESSHHHAN